VPSVNSHSPTIHITESQSVNFD